MIKIYKLDKKSKSKYFLNILLQLIFYYFVFVGLFAYFKGITSIELIIELSLVLLSFTLLIYFIPLIVFYLNYYLKSSKTKFVVNDSSETYLFQNKLDTIDFKLEDIDSIKMHLSSSTYHNSVDWLLIGKFHYARINLKSGSSFSISCLVCDEIEELFPAKIIERNNVIFPLM